MRWLFSDKNRAFHLLLISSAVVLSRFNAIFNGFVQDGAILVLENPFIKGWHNLPLLFSSGYWVSIGKTGGLYRPLSLVSFMVEYSLFGLNPIVYHVSNLLLHILCSILVYMLIDRLFGERDAALAGGLVFAVHPALTEIVATVQGRAELLSVFFVLAGLVVFITEPRRVALWAASPVLLLMGLLSKETAAVLPLLALLYLVLFEKDRRGSSLKTIATSLAPYAFSLGVYMALRIYAIGAGQLPPPESSPLAGAGTFNVFFAMMKAFTYYIRLAFFPVSLFTVYDFPPPESFLHPAVLFALAALGLFAAFSPGMIRRSGAVYFFSAWFIISLLPVSNIIPTGIIMSERAIYLPLVSFAAISGHAFSLSRRKLKAAGGIGKHSAIIFLSCVLAMFCSLSLARSTVWKDETLYFEQVIEDYGEYAAAYPDNARYHQKMAEAYSVMGMVSMAEDELLKALSIDPASHKAHRLLAMIYDDRGDISLAAEEAGKAYQLSGGTDDLALGVTASSLFKAGMLKEAEETLRKAISLKPDRAEHHINYGLMLKSLGRADESLESFMKAAEVNPVMPETHYQLGMMLGEMQRFGPAADELRMAVSLRPLEPTYRYYLAASLVGMGEKEKAASELEAALRINPEYQQARTLYEGIRRP